MSLIPDDQYFIDRAEHDAHADDYRPDYDDSGPFGNADPGPCCRACGNALNLTCENRECVCHAGRLVDADAVDRAAAALFSIYGPDPINGIDPYVLVTDVLRAALFPETIQCNAPCPIPQEHPFDNGVMATFLCPLPANHAGQHYAGVVRWPVDPPESTRPDLLASYAADNIEVGNVRRDLGSPGRGPLCDDACADEAAAAGTCRHTDGD